MSGMTRARDSRSAQTAVVWSGSTSVCAAHNYQAARDPGPAPPHVLRARVMDEIQTIRNILRSASSIISISEVSRRSYSVWLPQQPLLRCRSISQARREAFAHYFLEVASRVWPAGTLNSGNGSGCARSSRCSGARYQRFGSARRAIRRRPAPFRGALEVKLVVWISCERIAHGLAGLDAQMTPARAHRRDAGSGNRLCPQRNSRFFERTSCGSRAFRFPSLV